MDLKTLKIKISEYVGSHGDTLSDVEKSELYKHLLIFQKFIIGRPEESFLQQLRRLSVARAKEGFKTYENQPITYWTTAVIGEFGEFCNMIKKLKRAENGGHDSGHSYTAKQITPKMLREEIGGTLIYIDLLCSFLDIDLTEAITETFNEKSLELGFPWLLKSEAL